MTGNFSCLGVLDRWAGILSLSLPVREIVPVDLLEVDFTKPESLRSGVFERGPSVTVMLLRIPPSTRRNL